MKYIRLCQWIFAFGFILINLNASAEETPPPFHYSDDWTLVSAPPPAGPYRLVNIDPRIPGPSAVEPMPVMPLPQKSPAASGEEHPMPSESQTKRPTAQSAVTSQETQKAVAAPSSTPVIPGTAPAAGIPGSAVKEVPPVQAVPATEPPAVSESPESADNGWAQPAAPIQPPPPAYQRPYPQTWQRYAPPGAWYPYPSTYPGNRAMPPPGYYGQGGNDEPQVPPPPVYNGAYGRRPYNGSGW